MHLMKKKEKKNLINKMTAEFDIISDLRNI